MFTYGESIALFLGIGGTLGIQYFLKWIKKPVTPPTSTGGGAATPPTKV